MNELELFAATITLADSAERAALLDRECADKPELRARLDELLVAHLRSNPLLDQPQQPVTPETPGDAVEAADMASGEMAGTIIAGRYKLLQKIGEGGMGTVWMADQSEPVKRRVALKLMRVERAQSKTILSRFEAERQAIALMDHPHIARLLDAGATGAGQPFFVMELVKGVPLTDFCDAHKLAIPDRLNLFMQICAAVQHAHQKGIIHRDLKPSNILVESHDGKPVPKVIDFGLAKATSGLQLTERTLFTAFGSVMGTPLYMAPEQATFNAVDVDTRADIYALGVILYELLTGTTPITRDAFKKAALDEMLKLIREQEPPMPSSRLSSSDSAPSVAANRQMEPAKLGRFVKGELDWIALKALAKERERRYETANAFARDIERFLNHEPVTAGPPTAAYRLRKFLRRNRKQVIAASVVLLALVGGVIGTTVGLLEAEKKRKEAEQNLGFAKRVNQILGSVFAGLDPNANYATVADLRNALRDNLNKAEKELEGSAVGEPLEVAAMQMTLGSSLLGLGEYSLAVEVFGKALQTRQAKLVSDHPDTLISMYMLAWAYSVDGHPTKAVALYEETLEKMKAKLGPDHPQMLEIMSGLGVAYADRSSGQVAKAVPMLEEALEKSKVQLGHDHPHTLRIMDNLAGAYGRSGQIAKAVPLLEATLEKTKAKLGPDHPSTLLIMNNLAATYWQLKRLDRSIPLFEGAVKRNQKQLGRDHPDTLLSVGNLGVNYRDAGRLAEAIPLLEESYPASKKYAILRSFGPALLDAYVNAGKATEAAKLVGELLADFRQQVPKDGPQLADELARFSLSMLQVKAFPEVEPLLRECLAIRRKQMPDSWLTFNTQALLGGALLGQKKYAEAEPLLVKGYEGMKAREKTIPKTSGGELRVPEALDRLIELYTAINKPDEAKKWQAERAKHPQGKTKTPKKQ
jgi:non-specific serine/threonine protein kinase/serine/threonine-protein kinase